MTAASEWDAPAERKSLCAPLEGSYESLFHLTDVPRFYLSFENQRALAFNLSAPRLERAVGVIYRPETELISHYLTASLSNQFDAVIHIDHTRAVEPLEKTGEWKTNEIEETYPTGL